jgi:hypothetical protein
MRNGSQEEAARAEQILTSLEERAAAAANDSEVQQWNDSDSVTTCIRTRTSYTPSYRPTVVRLPQGAGSASRVATHGDRV